MLARLDHRTFGLPQQESQNERAAVLQAFKVLRLKVLTFENISAGAQYLSCHDLALFLKFVTDELKYEWPSIDGLDYPTE
jgi:hypothetical protein